MTSTIKKGTSVTVKFHTGQTLHGIVTDAVTSEWHEHETEVMVKFDNGLTRRFFASQVHIA